jgi:hypothetical protein
MIVGVGEEEGGSGERMMSDPASCDCNFQKPSSGCPLNHNCPFAKPWKRVVFTIAIMLLVGSSLWYSLHH